MSALFKSLTGIALTTSSPFIPVAAASHTTERAGNAAADDTLLLLRSLDERVWTIGHRLTTGALNFCPGGYAPGFTLQSVSQYALAFRAAASRLLGAQEQPSAGIVIAGSGADRAGLRRGDIIVTIDAAPIAAGNVGKRATFAGVERLDTEVDLASSDGTLALHVVRAGQALRITIHPDRGCPTRFDVRAGGATDASANGRYVQVGSDLVQSLTSDDDLAALLAHEIAHNILGHAKILEKAGGGLLSGFGKSGRTIRTTEIAADRLSLYILASAGYRIEPAIAFWDRFTRANDWGIFSDRTHPGPAKRVATLRREASRIAQLRAEGRPLMPPDDLLRSPETSDRIPQAR